MEYCQHCGGLLKKHNETAYTCQECGFKQFNNPKATVGIVIFKDTETVYLGRRAHEPFKGGWDIFGGFVDGGESLEDALMREVGEELGITIDDLENVEYLTSVYGDYPWMGHNTPVTTAVFIANLKPGVTLTPHDDVASIEELALTELTAIAEESRAFVRKSLHALLAHMGN